ADAGPTANLIHSAKEMLGEILHRENNYRSPSRQAELDSYAVAIAAAERTDPSAETGPTADMIRAAPALLAACKAAVPVTGGSKEWNGETHELLKRCEEAIALADPPDLSPEAREHTERGPGAHAIPAF